VTSVVVEEGPRVRKLRILLILILFAFLVFSSTSGPFLVVNHLAPADVIVVLAGETNQRPSRALQLLRQNYAPIVQLDVPENDVAYDRSMIDIATEYVQKLPEAQSITICPIFGLSTEAESHDVARCLDHSGVHRILVVTSDYHTRRARSIFQHELRDYQVFIAPAYDAQQFGASWWQHRQWAKTNFDEWVRLVWWDLVDRWR